MGKKNAKSNHLASLLEELRKTVADDHTHESQEFTLSDIVNIPALQKIMELRNLPIAILDNDNRILVAAAWQDVCVKFHRVHPNSAKRCQISDDYVKNNLNPDQFVSYHCANGMWDIALPIIIENRHVGTIFIGQFFYDDDNIDYEFFKRQGDCLGFDWRKYKKAIDDVPRYSKKEVENFMEFNRQIVNMLAEQGIANLKLKREMEERKRTEGALDFQIRVMGALLENLPVGVMMIDAETGKTLIENAEAVRLFGREMLPDIKEDTVNRRGIAYKSSTGELYPPEEMPVILGLKGISGHIDDMIIKHPDGSSILIEVFGSPIYNNEGKVIASLSIFFDTTERKNAENERINLERQILHAQKLESLGILAGGIAHDFNNLLTAVLGNASLALMDLPSLSPARYNIEEIEKASMRAADLAKQMLAYSGKGRFIIQDIYINDLLNEMSHLVSVSVPKNIELLYHLSGKIPLIQGDATQIRQIILNLITNAADAIGETHGSISVSSGSIRADSALLNYDNPAHRPGLDPDLTEKEYVYFEVADTGVGMDQATIDKIFDPFFSTKFTGRGLGLAAILGIVRGHQGAIKINSKPGVGTNFRVLFPAKLSVNPEKPLIKAQTPPSDISDAGTILIVDDEFFVRNTASNILSRYGFTALLADNGEAGVELFIKDRDSIRLILLDMTMPKMDGVATLREIRKISPDIPVILISGFSEQEAAVKFEGMYLAGFLQKPFSQSDLILKIKDVLAR
ncbi:MAG: response regulator [Brevinematales bacterium]|nr:response regulator [Brevinematales bacterium]